MRVVRPAIVLLGCLVAGQPAVGQAPATPRSFVVAVATSGWPRMLPLARYDSGRWSNTWPAPDHDSPVPAALPALADTPTAWLGGPVPRDWTFWLAAGGTFRTQVVGLEMADDVCLESPHLTLREAVRVPMREADPNVYDRHLATTGGVPVGAIRVLASPLQPSATAAALLARIQPAVEKLFTEHEGPLLEGPSGHGLRRAGVTVPLLASIRPKIDWAYATAASTSVLYFEASKRPPQATAGRLTVRGWLRLDRGEVAPFGIEAHPENDDGGPRGFALDQLPLGVVRAGGRNVWIVEVVFGETMSYVFYDVGPTAARKLLDVDAGGC